jgi:hypothetical protein
VSCPSGWGSTGVFSVVVAFSEFESASKDDSRGGSTPVMVACMTAVSGPPAGARLPSRGFLPPLSQDLARGTRDPQSGMALPEPIRPIRITIRAAIAVVREGGARRGRRPRAEVSEGAQMDVDVVDQCAFLTEVGRKVAEDALQVWVRVDGGDLTLGNAELP